MKKRIIFTEDTMCLGGVERALLGLLSSINYDKYDVDLFLLKHEGEFMNLIPSKVNILPVVPQYALFSGGSSVELLRRGYWKMALARKLPRLLWWLYGLTLKKGIINDSFSHYQIRAIMPYLPAINPDVEYDLAVAFKQPFHIVCRKIRAKRKIGWIHSDHSTTNTPARSEYKYWGSMDHFISISSKVAEGFISKFPLAAPKIVAIDHIIPKEFIIAQAQMEDVSQRMNEGVKLCTIGRITEAKNYINAVEICALMVKKNPDIYWYIIGGISANDNTGYYKQMYSKIIALGMQEHFILLGSQSNPYPYIAACDIYLQPSLHEAKSVAVIEAQILCKPTIITAYPTSKSQLRDGVDGVIVPLDNYEAAEGILAVINDKALQEKLSKNCASSSYTNISEVDKLYALIP